jgi:hypothetical protein
MPNIPTNKPGLAVGRDEVGAALGNVEAQIQALQADTSASTAVTVTIPQPCTGVGIGGGGFVLAYEVIKKGLRATFCATAPSDTVRTKTVIIKHSDATASATSFKQNRLQQTIELDTDQTASGHVEYKFQPLLEYNTQYDLIKLVAVGSDGTRLANPPTDAKFGDPPLATFTTPVMFGVPSDPGSVAPYVQFSGLDPDTGDHYATITLRMYAPLNVQTGAAQSWGAATVDLVHFVIALGSGKAKHYTVNLSGTDLSQTDTGSPSMANRGYVDITLKNLQVGDLITWIKNICWAGGERAVSVGAPVTIQAGGVQVNPANLINPGLNVITTDPYTVRDAGVDLLFTQPALPVALKWVSLERKLHTDPVGNYGFVLDRFMLKKQEYHTPGAHVVVHIIEGLHFKPSSIYDLRITFYAVGGLTSQVVVQNISTGADTTIPQDTLPPQGLTAPVLEFHKGVLTVSNMSTNQLQSNLLVDTAVVLTSSPTNPGPTNAGPFFDVRTYLSSGGATLQQAATEALAQFHIGPGKAHTNLNVRLRDLQVVFGLPGGPYLGNIYAYYYKTNEIGSSASPISTALNLGTAKDTTNSRDVASGVVAGALAVPGKQIFPNADFLLNDGLGINPGNQNTLGAWATYLLPNTPIPPNTGSIVVGDPLVAWDQAQHAIVWGTNSSRAVAINIRKGRLLPGDRLFFSAQFKSNGTPVGYVMRLYLKRGSDGADNIDNLFSPGLAYVEIPLDGTGPDGSSYQVNTSFQLFNAMLKIKDSPNLGDGSGGYANQFFIIQPVGVIGFQLTMIRPMLNRGQEGAAFSIQETEEGLTNIVPTSLTSTVDIVNVVGTRGGGVDTPGQGRVAIPAML